MPRSSRLDALQAEFDGVFDFSALQAMVNIVESGETLSFAIDSINSQIRTGGAEFAVDSAEAFNELNAGANRISSDRFLTDVDKLLSGFETFSSTDQLAPALVDIAAVDTHGGRAVNAVPVFILYGDENALSGLADGVVFSKRESVTDNGIW